MDYKFSNPVRWLFVECLFFLLVHIFLLPLNERNTKLLNKFDQNRFIFGLKSKKCHMLFAPVDKWAHSTVGQVCAICLYIKEYPVQKDEPTMYSNSDTKMKISVVCQWNEWSGTANEQLHKLFVMCCCVGALLVSASVSAQHPQNVNSFYKWTKRLVSIAHIHTQRDPWTLVLVSVVVNCALNRGCCHSTHHAYVEYATSATNQWSRNRYFALKTKQNAKPPYNFIRRAKLFNASQFT